MSGAERPSPYALVFEAAGFDASRFDLLREQAAAHGAVTVGAVLGLPAGGDLLRDLLPDEAGASHRDVVAQVGTLLFHGFRHWLHGCVLYRLDDAALDAVLAAAPAQWTFCAPAPAGYVQLPRHRFWARPADDAAAEPVDGFFWSAPAPEESGDGGGLDVLLALGVRAGRPGFTVVPASLEAGSDPAAWADADARPGDTEFGNILPGGELQGYRALATHAEVLKLAVRIFRHIDTHPGAVADHDGVRQVRDG